MPAFLINLLILLIVVALCYWVIGMLPLPDPIRQIAIVVLVVICAVYLIYMLMGMTASPGPWRRW